MMPSPHHRPTSLRIITLSPPTQISRSINQIVSELLHRPNLPTTSLEILPSPSNILPIRRTMLEKNNPSMHSVEGLQFQTPLSPPPPPNSFVAWHREQIAKKWLTSCLLSRASGRMSAWRLVLWLVCLWLDLVRVAGTQVLSAMGVSETTWISWTMFLETVLTFQSSLGPLQTVQSGESSGEAAIATSRRCSATSPSVSAQGNPVGVPRRHSCTGDHHLWRPNEYTTGYRFGTAPSSLRIRDTGFELVT